jgi:hypothetical protein
MAKTKKKLSRREREEQQKTRRLMLIGGGVFGLTALAGVGATMLDPSFPTLEGDGTIDERIERAAISAQVLNLTPTAEQTDILVIGTTDCSFCRDFVEDGLDDAVSFARENGLGMTYAPIGMSGNALGSTRLLGGFARHSKTEPSKTLKSVYEAAEEISRGGDLDEVTRAYGKSLGLSESQIDDVLGESSIEITRMIQATTTAFPIAGTPMFFVASEEAPGRINMFSGWAGKAGLRRQIKAARSA